MLLSILLASALLGFADEQVPVRARQVAATVDNEPIATAEVDREIALAVKGQTLQEEALSRLKKLALEQVIDRHLILKYLQANKQAASKDDVDFALARLVRQLKAKNTPLADHLKAIGMSEAELRQELLWKISWARYVEARSSDENLKKYFDLHRADFDGTEVKVAHILWTVPADDDAKRQAALKTAGSLREEITNGETAFADAAKKHSQAPTAKDGGNIGAIRRHEPMPEEFTRAAFALKKSEVSQPVVTAFGVHLIQALEITPGKKTWEDCRDELRPAVTLYLFRWIAEKERKTAKISYAP